MMNMYNIKNIISNKKKSSRNVKVNEGKKTWKFTY